MHHRFTSVLALSFLFLGGFGVVDDARATAGAGSTDLLVVFEPTAAGAADEAAHDRADARSVKRIDEAGVDVVSVDDPDQAIAEYQRDPAVKYVEVDGRVSVDAVDDPLYDLQWHLHKRSGSNKGTANVEPAWSRATGKGITVAVIDTGVTAGNDLDSSRVIGGYDFVNGDSNPADDHSKGHGTHIAGTIAQTTDNDRGAAGVAPKAKIMPIKVLDAAGVGSYSDVIQGINYAVDHGAHVLNLSLSGATHSRALCDAVADASRRVTVVAATGNEGLNSVSYPAACDGAVGVGAVRYDGTLAPYSNSGSAVDLVAPGGDSGRDQNGDGYEDSILQQTRKSGSWGYWWFEGTSMAAAHVSGVAALILDVDSKADVPSVLQKTARDAGPKGRDNLYGAGIVDAAAAVGAVGAQAEADGYWLAARAGDVHAFGNIGVQTVGASGTGDTVAIESIPSGGGYWTLDSAGGVRAVGDAKYHGSIPGLRDRGHNIGHADPIDISTTPSGRGYWILDSAGGIFTFGDAKFFGSIPGLRNQGHNIGLAKVMDLASTPTGDGYWILDQAGGIFTFGDAKFFGSVPGLRDQGIKVGRANLVALAPTESGRGYWLTDDVGGVFSFGNATFKGSIPALRDAGHVIGRAEVVDMIPTRSGGGYWQVDDAGGIFTFGDAKYHGSMPGIGVPGPAAGMAVAE